MNNKLFFLLFLFGSVMCVFAQGPQLPEQVTVKFPEILNSKSIQMSNLVAKFHDGSKWGQDGNTIKKFWKVYSDRGDNVTYTDPQRTKEMGKLRFGDDVYIAEIKGNMALVFTTNYPNNYPNMPGDAICKGWVPLKHLLLWSQCPTDQRGVEKKGIIAINLNEMKTNEKFEKRLYTSPDKNSVGWPLSMDMEFYYVMKEEGAFTLLCKGNEMDKGAQLYGWVNKNAYTEWNQRSCLEPNWIPKFVNSHRGQEVYIYETKDGNESVCHWKYGTSNGDPNSYYKYRMHPNQLRFPILSKPDDNGRVLCTSFADRTRSINEAGEMSDIQGTVNDVRNGMKQMNVILAVEATAQMADFMPAIKDALALCGHYEKQEYNVRVGLVLYGAQGTRVQSLPLRKYNDTQLLKMLDRSKAQTRLTGHRDVALQQAIERAVDPTSMGFNKKQSNLLLVIGYHGPNMAVWNEPRLLEKLVENNIQLASIQIMRTPDGSCQRYYHAMDRLIDNNVNKQYQKINASAKSISLSDNSGYKFLYSLSEEKQGNPLFASIRFNPKMNVTMATTDLTRNVKNSMSGFYKSIEDSQSMFEHSLNDITYHPKFLRAKLGDEGYEAWRNLLAISAYGGYAEVKKLDSDDKWQAVLYLSYNELEDLIERLSPVSQAAVTKNSDRTIYIQAIRALLKHQLGGSIPEEKINEMEPEELAHAIYGIVNVPSESLSFTNYKLVDLSNRRKVTDVEYQEVLNRFVEKYNKLSKLRNSNYRYCMKVGNMKYYWIPLEDLP